jgi:UDP-3-O-[3-hydroxymyristoyl] glucosamine N-acyltransferase
MISVSEISKLIDGQIVGNKDLLVKGICSIKNGKEGYLTYLKNNSYKKYIKDCKASVFIIDNDYNNFLENKTFIKVKNSGLSFIKILEMFKNRLEINKKSAPSLGNNVDISNNVTFGKNVIIGSNSTIHSGCFIGDNSNIGENTIIYPNVVIYNDVEIGDNCTINGGCIIGADGFGLIESDNIFYNIPHIGKVIIGNSVSIGSNSCIDRGTIDDTIIGDNVKIDNMVQIAHNVKINNNCVIAGQVGIAGSTVLYENVKIGGGAGIIDNLEIGKNSIIVGNSFVWKSIKENSFVSGDPAEDHKLRLKKIAALNKILDKNK